MSVVRYENMVIANYIGKEEFSIGNECKKKFFQVRSVPEFFWLFVLLVCFRFCFVFVLVLVCLFVFGFFKRRLLVRIISCV